jgi:hypothetical protein
MTRTELADVCVCRRCNVARMVAAWTVLEQGPQRAPRWEASLLLARWAQVTDSNLPMPQDLRQAADACLHWIQEHGDTLRWLAREVSYSGQSPGTEVEDEF